MIAWTWFVDLWKRVSKVKKNQSIDPKQDL